jgi:hypothetical protein
MKPQGPVLGKRNTLQMFKEWLLAAPFTSLLSFPKKTLTEHLSSTQRVPRSRTKVCVPRILSSEKGEVDRSSCLQPRSSLQLIPTREGKTEFLQWTVIGCISHTCKLWTQQPVANTNQLNAIFVDFWSHLALGLFFFFFFSFFQFY